MWMAGTSGKSGKENKSPRNTSSEEETGNPTRDKLAGLPFETASELKAARQEINLSVWRRLEEARQMNDLLARPEFSFVSKEFEKGFLCAYGERQQNIAHVFSDPKEGGIKVLINKELTESGPSAEIVGVMVKSLSASFAETYYKAKGILPNSDSTAMTKDLIKAMADAISSPKG